jgi:DNA replication protein DnaC
VKLKPVHPQVVALENAVYDFCTAYAKHPREGYRLIIHGENGAGKSHAAKAINAWAKRMAMWLPWVVNENASLGLATSGYYSWPQLMNEMKSGAWDNLDELYEKNLVVLDDVGADHDPSKIGVEKLYLLLERRSKKWTVITTNIRPDAWEEKFERRIASRFARNSKMVALDEVQDYSTQ